MTFRPLLLALALGAMLPAGAQLPASFISAGPHQTCAIVSGGALRCWGDNANGSLGNGAFIPESIPARVVGLGPGVVDVATGHSITCAVNAAGGVSCWGKRILAYANHPTSYIGESNVPVPVPGLESGVAKISMETSNACVVTTGGGVKCWGYNYSGQLADGTTVDKPVPSGQFVPGLESGVRDVVTAGRNTCVLTTAGGVKCWGFNADGQLGDGTLNARMVPGDVIGLTSGVTSLARGVPDCAVMQTGEVKCWGQNAYAQADSSRPAARTTPITIQGLRGRATLVASTGGVTCVALEAGGIQCWGYNGFGGLGNPAVTQSPTPVDVAGISGRATSLSINSYHGCAIVDGIAKCWGQNTYFHLGDATSIDRPTPVNVSAREFMPSFQGLWWKSPGGSESGWGLSLVQQGNTLFAAWFTYGSDGKPIWYVMPDGRRQSGLGFGGKLYEVTGPVFSTKPWNANAVHATEVGEANISFSDSNTGQFSYYIRSVSTQIFSKPITRQVFGSTQPTCELAAVRTSPWNFTDVWWGAPAGSESGWGLNVTHQADTIFAAWYTYDAAGRPTWVILSNGAKVGPNTYSGALYRTTGPAFFAEPWSPGQVSAVPAGTAKLTFGDPDNGMFEYTLDGVSQTRAITRQHFSSPVTVCN